MYLSGGAVALSLIALIAILVGRGPSRDDRSDGAEAADRCLLRVAQTRQTPRLSVFW